MDKLKSMHAIDDETCDMLLAGACKGCADSTYIKSGMCCPYVHGLTCDRSHCYYHHKSAYQIRKEKKEQEAIALGKLVIENGIEPKYKIGDEVYLSFRDKYSVEVQTVRQIVASDDGKSYVYKISGHNYVFDEHSLYPSREELHRHHVEVFTKEMLQTANMLNDRAVKYGYYALGSDSRLLQLLCGESGTNTNNND